MKSLCKKIHVFRSEEFFIHFLSQEIIKRIMKGIKKNKVFRLALSGGKTPKNLYKYLSKQKNIPWSKVEIFLVDERYVPLEDENSNYKMIHDHFIQHLYLAPKKFVFFHTELSISQALQRYKSELLPRQKFFFNLILLGIGVDGHIASLFPYSPVLKINDQWVAYRKASRQASLDRLTLTYPALESSKEIFFLLKGNGKKDILKDLMESKKIDFHLPAARLFHKEKSTVFYCR